MSQASLTCLLNHVRHRAPGLKVVLLILGAESPQRSLRPRLQMSNSRRHYPGTLGGRRLSTNTWLADLRQWARNGRQNRRLRSASAGRGTETSRPPAGRPIAGHVGSRPTSAVSSRVFTRCRNFLPVHNAARPSARLASGNTTGPCERRLQKNPTPCIWWGKYESATRQVEAASVSHGIVSSVFLPK